MGMKDVPKDTKKPKPIFLPKMMSWQGNRRKKYEKRKAKEI
jgi:hypothetical protein